MRRHFLAGLIVSATLGAALGASGVIGSAPPAATAASAVVVLESGCFLLDGNGAFVSGGRSQNRVEITKESDGAVTERCQAVLAPARDGETREWTSENTGMPCTLQVDGVLSQTDDWHEEVSPDGEAVLVCRLAPAAG